MTATYRLRPHGTHVTATDGIECLLCGAVSYHPDDIAEHYCARCHLYHDVVARARIELADGAAHECAEWPTARGVCAVCGKAGA